MATPKAQQKSKDKDSISTPLSPSINSRKDEKDQMINLNNRMAIYVEKVRSLESENSKLQIQISNFEQTTTREVTNVKAMYESELAEARRLMDELSKEKAQLQIEATSFREKYEAEHCRANELNEDNTALEGKLKDLNTMLVVKDSQYNRMRQERDALVEEVASLKMKLRDVQEELDSTQKMLEKETLLRVDFENKLQSAKEELLFKERVHHEEISEVRKRHTVSVTEIDQQVKGVYESRLEAAIMDLRDQQTADLEQMREDLQHQYSSKISGMTKRLDSACELQLKAQEKLKASELKAERFQANIKVLQSQNSGFTSRIQDLEAHIETERELRISSIISIEKQRDEAREMLKSMEKDYSELFDLKVKLDHEIAIYRKLLEEEEQRLNLSPSPQGDGSRARTRARRKRKRVIAQVEGESEAKKLEVTSSYSTETVVVQRTQRHAEVGKEDMLHQQPDPAPEGNNSCTIM